MPVPTPMSPARLEEMLAGCNLDFAQDDGQLIVPTVNALYFWSLHEQQILQVRAQWRGTAHDSDSFTALSEAVTMCNATRSGPKAYLIPFEEGRTYGLSAECNIITSAGLTAEQLNSFCETSMAMIMSFFSDLEAAHPELVTWKDASSAQQTTNLTPPLPSSSEIPQ